MKHEDSNVPTVWLSACITLRVLELNRASINNAPPVSSQSGASVLLASQTQNTFSSASFTDLLATAQAESLNVQNETTFNPAIFNQSLTQQSYQNGNSGAAWSSSNSAGGESEQAPVNFSTTPQQLSSSASSPAQAPPKEDVYESSAASAHRSSTVESESSTDSASASTTNNSGSKATDKSKTHKEVNMAAGAQYSQTSVNSGSHAGTAGKDPAVGAAANGDDSVASTSQSRQTISEPALRTSNAKSTVTNASLAFAVRIQGNGSQSPVAETDSGVAAPAATTDQNMPGLSSEFAAQLSGMMGLTMPKVNPNAGLANGTGGCNPRRASCSSQSACHNSTGPNHRRG
jgi:hypothetical protein